MTKNNDRVFGLDLLRAIAVLTIVYFHGTPIIAPYVPPYIYQIPVFDGVSMFFVLSGFLVGGILLRTMVSDGFGWHALKVFWVRRWFRTLPNYFLVLTVLTVTFFLLTDQAPNQVSLYFIFSQNFASPHPGFFQEAWSLAVEEWFYLSLPIPLCIAIWLGVRDRRRLMLYWAILLIVAVTVFRLYRANRFGLSTIGQWNVDLRTQVLTRLDSLMFGVLGAYVKQFHTHAWNAKPRSMLTAGVLLLVLDKVVGGVFGNVAYLNYFSLSITAIGTLLLLPKLSSWQRPTDWFTKVITFVSLTAYAMYLLNFTAVQTLMHYFRPFSHPVAAYALYWTTTVALAYLLYTYFEKPITDIRERWPTRTAGVRPPPGVPTAAARPLSGG